MTEKFTGKERDAESGLDYFGARYYGSALGRFTSPDWSANPIPVPYANLRDPQTLNLYAYVRNNPVGHPDADGHCPTEDGCSAVKVEVSVDRKPSLVENEKMKAKDGKLLGTGVEGKFVITVKVDDHPAKGVKVTEKNAGSETRNGEPISGETITGKAKTDRAGQVSDTVGTYQRTDGKQSTNDVIKADYSSNIWTVTDTQTLTLKFPGGTVCSCTYTRTLTNGGEGGPSSTYDLQPTNTVLVPKEQ